MRTTLDLPDGLMREVKIRAAQRDQKLKEVVEELLRLGLGQAESKQSASPAVSVPRPAKGLDSRSSHPKTRSAESVPNQGIELTLEPVDESVIDSSFPL